jgi:pimeloyl-ACP methyl ester carboxylesterase
MGRVNTSPRWDLTVKTNTKSAELSNGVKLPYVEQGDASGPSLLLLHGVTDSWRSFELVLPHLPRSIHAIAVTQRGHGDADRPQAAYRTADFAADVGELIELLRLGPTVVVGHSMGSTNAMRFASDQPELTRGLVLAAAFSGYRNNPVLVDFWETAVAQLADPIDPAFVRDFQQSTLAQPVPAEFFDVVVKESLKVPARVWRAAFEGFMTDDPLVGLWGAHDELCKRHDQELLLSSIADSQLIVYENAGHALHWEEPQRFAADLEAFVQRLVE